MSNVARLRTRKPTYRPSWPLILLAGEAKTGKTYTAALFTGDERVGRSFMLDLGEGCADEYGAVPGANYEIIEHDGTWPDIIGQVEAVRELARETLAKGEKPVCLIIDSMTAEWGMLSAWTDTRARRSRTNRKLLEDDPDAEIEVGHMYWNDANSRHNRLMNLLKTFPGIVIMTALETEKTQFGPDGKPLKINGQPAPKLARPDGQKRLTADATAWIRLALGNDPVIVGLRSVKRNIDPRKDKPETWRDFTLGRFVFEFLEISPDTAQVRATPLLNADQTLPEEQPPAGGPTPEQLEEQRRRARGVVTWALEPADPATAKQRSAKLAVHTARDHDVLPFIDQDTRDRLGIPPEVTRLTLAELGQTVAGYVERHHRSPLWPVEQTSPDPAPPAEAPDGAVPVPEVCHVVANLVAATTQEQALDILAKIKGTDLAHQDVLPMLSDDERDILGIAPGTTRVVLTNFATRVAAYVTKHHRAIRDTAAAS